MSRYINLDTVIERLENDLKTGDERVPISWVKGWLETQEKADVVEVRHGKWIWVCNLNDDDFYECSVCGRQEVINGLCRERNPVEHLPYCNCGAKMDGERKENGT